MMKKIFLLFPLFVFSFFVVGCQSITPSDTKNSTLPPSESEAPLYTDQSWETLIDDSCQVFFDGCNTCRRMSDGGAGCTRMMCQVYEQPRCMDDEVASSSENENAEISVPDYIGLTVEEAQELAEQQGTSFRVVEQDGQALPATMDWRPGRINASVENNIVIGFDVEGAETDNTSLVESEYDMNSWKGLIDDSCQVFFDGCNTCQRMPDGGAGCTRMMCQTYESPRCLDAENVNSEQ